jgi:hypothetical protein
LAVILYVAVEMIYRGAIVWPVVNSIAKNSRFLRIVQVRVVFEDCERDGHSRTRVPDFTLLSRFAPRAGLVTLRQTFFRCCHGGWLRAALAVFPARSPQRMGGRF